MSNGIMLWSACLASIAFFAVRKIPLLQKVPLTQVAQTAATTPTL
jgi:hypothetical protein